MRSPCQRTLQALRWLWASPCTVAGLVLALLPLMLGGRAVWAHGALEVSYRPSLQACGRHTRAWPYRGIVFGHVILAITAEDLQHIGPHERVHVRQYERWGPLFFVAYPASSLWQWVRGRDPYWENAFEVEARSLSAPDAQARTGSGRSA